MMEAATGSTEKYWERREAGHGGTDYYVQSKGICSLRPPVLNAFPFISRQCLDMGEKFWFQGACWLFLS